jgi:hypothetical protein
MSKAESRKTRAKDPSAVWTCIATFYLKAPAARP